MAGNTFLLHLDVDVIGAEELSATNYPSPGGLCLEDVRQALEVFVRQENLAAFEISVYNPERDADGADAKTLVDLLAAAFAARRAALVVGAPPVAATKEAEEAKEAEKAEEKVATEAAPEIAVPSVSQEAAPSAVAAEEAAAEPSLPQDAPAEPIREES